MIKFKSKYLNETMNNNNYYDPINDDFIRNLEKKSNDDNNF